MAWAAEIVRDDAIIAALAMNASIVNSLRFALASAGIDSDGISGAIKLLQYADIEKFVAEGAKLKDGSVAPAELLVLATGYKNQQDTVRAYLGDEIADKIGLVWGFDEGGELRNRWRRTQQAGLWFTAGSLAQCRIFSRYLAIQIKALSDATDLDEDAKVVSLGLAIMSLTGKRILAKAVSHLGDRITR
jgi:hypothetical protein